jgi:KTSC domain
MPRISLNSRSLRTAGYLDTDALLEVEFRSGDVYQFFDVPAESYQALLQAESHGKYFNSHIRNRFAFVKIHQQANTMT